jgi:hypothetical protein
MTQCPDSFIRIGRASARAVAFAIRCGDPAAFLADRSAEVPLHRESDPMTKTMLALLGTLALGSGALPARAANPAGDWELGGNAGQEVQDEHAPVAPIYGGGWPAGVTGEAAGAFEARAATVELGGGEPRAMTGEAGGSFERATATRLGGRDGGAGLAALRAAEGS